jgi:endonuclease/exonuclease/phosphatase family metal-dependent hydrolase
MYATALSAPFDRDASRPVQQAAHPAARPRPSYTAITYNVRHCRGIDGRLSPQRIADVVAHSNPDILALQELDVGRARTGHVDQAQVIALSLGMVAHFHPALRSAGELYGDAILTRGPSQLVKAAALPSPREHRRDGREEPRGALWVSTKIDGRTINIVNTHFGLTRPERRAQVEALLGAGWISDAPCDIPLLLLGDFNTLPGSRTYRALSRRLMPAAPPTFRRQTATFPSRFPVLALDHIFGNDRIVWRQARTLNGPLPRAASDHLPLLAEFEFVT